MAFKPTLAGLMQFLQDIPFGQVAGAVEAGGLNVALDVSVGEAIVAAALKDFFDGETPTTAASTAAVAGGIPTHVAKAATGAAPSANASA